MTEDFGIDDIKKLFSVFGYRLHEVPECLGTYVVNDCDGNFVYWMPAAFDSVSSYTVHELMLVLSRSSVFFIYETSVEASCGPFDGCAMQRKTMMPSKKISNIKKNIFYGKSLHEMMVAYDLMPRNNEV